MNIAEEEQDLEPFLNEIRKYLLEKHCKSYQLRDQVESEKMHNNFYCGIGNCFDERRWGQTSLHQLESGMIY